MSHFDPNRTQRLKDHFLFIPILMGEKYHRIFPDGTFLLSWMKLNMKRQHWEQYIHTFLRNLNMNTEMP